MRKKILISISKARSMYQKGVGYLVGYPVGYLAIYPRPSTKTASWTENWITDITESNS